MKRFISKSIYGLVALMAIGISADSAFADGIVFLGQDPCFPAGVGRGCGDTRAEHVLSLQRKKNGNESGAVGVGSDGQDVRTGDWSRGANTKTVSLTEIGLTQASNVRIFFDIIEPNGGNKSSVTLNYLVLTAYNANGGIVFSASLVSSPMTLDQVGNGQGHSDYVFGLDSEAAARLQIAINANPNLRLGLIADISNADGGPESFFIGNAPNSHMIPSPIGPAAMNAEGEEQPFNRPATKNAGRKEQPFNSPAIRNAGRKEQPLGREEQPFDSPAMRNASR